jgi:predicted GNAT family N-acyltransferase
MLEIHFVQPGWPEHDQALALRTEAFFTEHGGRAAAEERDRPGADHAVVTFDDEVIACGQGHIADGCYHISQMAVKEDRRGEGFGTMVLLALLERAEEHGYTTVRLEARSTAVDFYAHHGFVATTGARPIGAIGFPHVAMERTTG